MYTLSFVKSNKRKWTAYLAKISTFLFSSFLFGNYPPNFYFFLLLFVNMLRIAKMLLFYRHMDQKCTHQNHSDTIRFCCKNLEQEKMKQDIFRYICIGGCGSTFHSSFPFNGSGDAVSFPIVFSPFHFILLFRSYITFITTIIILILIIIKPSNAVVSVYSIAFFSVKEENTIFSPWS